LRVGLVIETSLRFGCVLPGQPSTRNTNHLINFN